MTISESSPPNASRQMELELTSFAEDFPVKTSPLQEREPDWTAPARDYGQSSPVWLASYDPSTSSWRTSQHCLEGGLAEFSESFPRSGMTRNGTAYLLAPLTRLTDEIESGLLPTPSATRYGTSNNGCPGDGRTEYRLKGKPSLETMARKQLWPTPTSSEHTGAGRAAQGGVNLRTAVAMFPTPTAGDAKASGSRNVPGSQAHAGTSLTDFVRQDGGTGRWKTPMAADSRGSSGRMLPGKQMQLVDQVRMLPSPAARDYRSGKGRQDNGHTPQLPEVMGGQLNPEFVEWLLGYPRGWTEI